MNETVESPLIESDAKLSIQALEARFAAAAEPVVTKDGVFRYLWLFVFLIAGFGVTSVAQLLPGDVLKLSVALTGFGIEVAALGLIVKRQSQDVFTEIRYSRKDFAKDLEEDARTNASVVAWIRRFPATEIAFLLRYLTRRLEVFKQRHALLFGPVEKLGILPVLVALPLQFNAIVSMKTLGIWVWLLAGFIVLTYVLSLWMLGMKHQLERYVRVFELASSD